MEFNYAKLKGRITEKFGSDKNFANAVNITPESVSKKLSNKTIWKQPEIIRACEALNIDKEEIGLYFFSN